MVPKNAAASGPLRSLPVIPSHTSPLSPTVDSACLRSVSLRVSLVGGRPAALALRFVSKRESLLAQCTEKDCFLYYPFSYGGSGVMWLSVGLTSDIYICRRGSNHVETFTTRHFLRQFS